MFRNLTIAAICAAFLLSSCAHRTPEEIAARIAFRDAKIAHKKKMLAERADRATPLDLIKPIPASPLMYSHMTCAEIASELSVLNDKEAKLSYLQTRRLYRENVQTLFIHTGQGDGEEYAQIAVIRGKRDAAISALEQKCTLTPETPSANETTLAPAANEKAAKE
ncbi:MAG: hypothetical protein LBJ59_05905 [Zoogloeaceae bacterium]|jgi:hypothetical protein|nr:hypothetical protein [Zoogloeaceae bacterium]